MIISEDQELAAAYHDQRVMPFVTSDGMSRMQVLAMLSATMSDDVS